MMKAIEVFNIAKYLENVELIKLKSIIEIQLYKN